MAKMSDQREASSLGAAGHLNQKEYARRRGWSKQYVNQLVKQGRIPLVNGRIDPIAADAALAGMRDPSRAPRSQGNPTAQATVGSAPNLTNDSAPGMQGTFAKARTVREHFRALREKMEFEAAAGELVRRQEVEDAGHEIGTFFREHMMRAAEPIGALIADRFKVDYGGAVAVATMGITQALQRLGDEIRDNEWGFDLGLAEETEAGGKDDG